MPIRPVLILSLALLSTLGMRPAHAALGERADSIDSERAALKATLAVTTAASYRVHALTLPGGTVLREFVNGDGLVFAVAWNGPFMPDLSHLLGAYYSRWLAGEIGERVPRKYASYNDGEVIIESSGHARSFTGRAFLPAAIPAGVTRDELH